MARCLNIFCVLWVFIVGGILASPTTHKLTLGIKLKLVKSTVQLHSVFTGMHANFSKGDFMTINGIPLSNLTLPCSRGEPNSLGEDEDCLAMSNAGELADVSCASNLPYFCYKSKAVMAESVCGTDNGTNYVNREAV